MNETIVTMCGNVAVGPERIVSAEGLTIASFRIAANSRRFDREQRTWVDGDTTWMTVTCFRALAANVLESVHTGQPVIVRGRLQTREWQKEERKGTRTELVAQAVGHDLSWGRSSFTKATRSERQEPGRAEADQLATAMEFAGPRDPFDGVPDDAGRAAVLAEHDDAGREAVPVGS
jgi:single-strand DNA-binding protein